VAAADGEDPAPAGGRAEREDHGGPDVAHRGPRRRGGALVGGEVGAYHRSACPENLSGQRLPDREDQAAYGQRVVPVRVGDREPSVLLVGERENREVGIGQLAGLAGDAGEDLARLGAGQERRGDLGAGLAGWPRRLTSYSRAFSIATPAAAPRASSTASSSSSVNSPPPRLLVRPACRRCCSGCRSRSTHCLSCRSTRPPSWTGQVTLNCR